MITGIDHVNIRTLDISGTVHFYTNLIGLRYDGPSQSNGFARHWLRDGRGRAIIHLRELASDMAGTGAVDYVALSSTAMMAVIARLEQAGADYARFDITADGIVQIFVTDPNGVTLELTFCDSDTG